ncbi:hypothetical protein G7046_g5471 [Stylonectria norvegica]|nr:hypothetical protein G7046_g5471 [Stylonectria norvegica]
MSPLERLPNEVLYEIALLLHKKYDLAALSRVNRHCYNIASQILWRREVKSDRPGALHWAVDRGVTDVFLRALDAGVDPSRLAYSHKPKSRIDPVYKWWNYHSSYYDDPEWRLDDDDESVDLDPGYVLHNHCNCFAGGCDEGIFNDCSWEPIHIAASKGRIDMIEKLLEKGANIDAFSWGFCLCRPHLPMEAFQESQAVDEEELEDLHGGGWTPLHIAICHGQVETAKFLLRRGASTVIYQGIDFELAQYPHDEVHMDPLRFRLTAMHHAAKHDQVPLLKFLLEGKYQRTVNPEGPFMGTPLMQAIWYGHWDTVVPWLLENGASLDARLIETRLTPLMMACFSRRFDDAAKLIDLGANVTTLSVHQFSILHLILGPSQLRNSVGEYDEHDMEITSKSITTEAEIIQKFIANGFPVDARESLLGMTPLMVASASCNVPAMKALLDGGADVNALDHDGLTALARVGEAASEDSAISHLYDAGYILLEAGATLKDSMEDLTPLNIICSRHKDINVPRDWETQHAKLAELLIERGANPNDKGVSASRPFTEALMHGNYPLAQAILEKGGRPEPHDIETILRHSARDMYDEGKAAFIVGLDFAKFGIVRPSDAFFVRHMQIALNEQLWSRAADLIIAAPTPKDMRKGLIHRSLMNSVLAGDDPTNLVQKLLDLGEDPNGLWEGEPPLYYSLKSAYCWRSTPALVDAGADVDMVTTKMPDGAFMFSINAGYQSQALQMLARHPNMMRDRAEKLHQQCWASVIRWEPVAEAPALEPGAPLRLIPYIYWNIAKRLMGVGLRTDVKLFDGRSVKSVVEMAVPTHYGLGLVEREVLELFGIPYEEPAIPSDEEESVGVDDDEDDEGYPSMFDFLGDTDDMWDEDEDEHEDEFDSEDEDDHEFPAPMVLGLYM